MADSKAADNSRPGSVLTGSQRERLDVVTNKQLRLRQWLATRQDYSEEEKSAIECRNYSDFATYWLGVAECGKDDLEQGRQRGWKKWAAKYQSYGKGVHRFMQDWEPLVGVVKGFGGGYGDLAIGTILLVFVIAKNKNESESFVAAAFANIKDRMMGFAMYENMYTESTELESDLRTKIVHAYSVFIELAIEAIKYYKGGGPWRWLRTIKSPGRFKRMAAEVEDSIVAVRLRCEDLLSQNINEIKLQLTQLQQKTDYSSWQEICSVWKHAEFYSKEQRDKSLTKYRTNLNENLRPGWQQFSAHESQRLAFESSEEYCRWTEPNQSKLLILIGYSERSIAIHQYYCWLSPWVLDLIKECEQERRDHAYYILPVDGERALDEVVASLLLQLLHTKIAALRDYDCRQNLNSMYTNATDKQTSAGHRSGAFKDLATKVIDFFAATERVDVFVDRLDRCRKEQRIALLDILAHMTQTARCTLKVVIIISGSDWIFPDSELDMAYAKHVEVRRAVQEIEESADE